MLNDTNIQYLNTFSRFAPQGNCTFNSLFLNIRSLRNRLTDLTDYVQYSKIPIQIIILNETRLNDSEKHLFNIPGFQSFHATRIKSGGGVSIFVHNSLSQANLMENFEFENNNFLSVKLLSINVSIAGVYKPPDTNCTNFLKQLDEFLERNPNSFVFGDFNLNLFDRRNQLIQNYRNTIESNGFKLLNCIAPTFYTRLNPTTKTTTCIDHVFTDEFITYDFILALDDVLNVDHKAMLLSISRENRSKEISQKKSYTFSKINHDNIIRSRHFENSPTSTFSALIDDCQKTLKENTKTFRLRERFRKPYMNSNILSYMQIRDNYQRLTKKYSLNVMAHSRYRFYRNKVTSLLRSVKKKRTTNIFQNMPTMVVKPGVI